ncbi:hypothetical protein Ancab_023833 [Ancistrocladus abbreviatus]
MSRRNPTSEANDPAIKLFGRDIPVPDSLISSDSMAPEFPAPTAKSMSEDFYSFLLLKHFTSEYQDAFSAARKLEVGNCSRDEVNREDGNPVLDEDEKNKFQSPTQENMKIAEQKPDKCRAVECNTLSQEKAFRKPDKILPCPRCNSMETKFCYFNNYNVNQPRHFCKSCQRYWTAGGTVRNVPVGAGRRKNKHASSHFQPVGVSSSEGAVSQVNLSCSNHSQASHAEHSSHALSLREARVEGLKVESDPQLSESVVTMLTIQDKKNLQDTSSIASAERTVLSSPSGSLRTSAVFRKTEFSENAVQKEQVGFCGSQFHGNFIPLPNVQGFLGPPLAYPWNSGWNGMAYGTDGVHIIPVPWGSSAVASVPRFCAPSIAFPSVHPSYWGWDASACNLQSSSSLSPVSSTGNGSCSGNSSPSLGKHSRELNSQDGEKTEKCLWVPKTLRIDDPDEAAKSSIWATLGIKPHKDEPFSKGGIFKAFPSKTKANLQTSETEQVLKANPAALSRSHAFQESS